MTTLDSLAKKTVCAIIALILLTPWSGWIDLHISHLFFTNDHFETNAFLTFIFNYAFYPAWIVVILSILVLAASFFLPKQKKWRLPAIYLILTLAIGAGLIVHATLKDHWGRPRPRQTTEFGGMQPFRPYYDPNFSDQPEPSKSFPCGHCSMGFFFFSLAFLGLHYRKKGLYFFWMITAFLLGGVLSYVRIAQGGHFLFDTLIAALIMWLTSFGLYLLLFKNRNCHERIE